MADAFVQVAVDGAGKRIDNDVLTVSATTVYRQRTVTASPSNALGLAEVVNAVPTTQFGSVVWTAQLPALVSGRLPVDGSGVTQPVSGSVTVSGTVTANAGSGTFTVGGTVTANQGGSWTVTVGAALPAGGNVIGAVTQSGTWNVTVNTALPAGANSIGTVVLGAGTADAGKVRFSVPTTSALTSASINASASGDNTLVAAVAAQTVRVFKLFLVANGAVNIKFKDGAATDLTAVMNLNIGGSITIDLDGEPWFLTSAGNAFVLNLSAAVQVSGRIYFTQS